MAVDLDKYTNAVAVYEVDSTGNPVGAGTTASPTVVKSAPFNYLGKSRITATATSSTSIGTVPAGATVAIVQNRAAVAANWAVGAATLNDQDIAATTGVVTLDLGNTSLNLVQFIAASGTFDLRIIFGN